MRLVMVADTHDMIGPDYRVPDGDVFIHAGDFTMQGFAAEIERFNTWLGTLPHKHKIVIPGNHELNMDEEFNPEYLKFRELITNATLLVNQGAIIDGVKFYGMPDTPEFFNWAFNRNQAEMVPFVEAIPADTDVLITHGPPYGILDPVRRKVVDDRGNIKWIDEKAGCLDLMKKVTGINPLVHVFGHIHKGYGFFHNPAYLKTKFFNAAICTERYRPENEPLVVDI